MKLIRLPRKLQQNMVATLSTMKANNRTGFHRIKV